VGARTAQLVGTTASGERIGAIDLPLPDWNQLATDAAKAFVAMEAQRMQRKCTVDLRVLVSSPH
jgi:hypothetical protein